MSLNKGNIAGIEVDGALQRGLILMVRGNVTGGDRSNDDRRGFRHLGRRILDGVCDKADRPPQQGGGHALQPGMRLDIP